MPRLLNYVFIFVALAAPELPPATTDFSGMSRDDEAVHGYATDPLVYRGRYKRPLLEAEMIALDEFQANIDALTMPVLFSLPAIIVNLWPYSSPGKK